MVCRAAPACPRVDEVMGSKALQVGVMMRNRSMQQCKETSTKPEPDKFIFNTCAQSRAIYP